MKSSNNTELSRIGVFWIASYYGPYPQHFTSFYPIAVLCVGAFCPFLFRAFGVWIRCHLSQQSFIKIIKTVNRCRFTRLHRYIGCSTWVDWTVMLSTNDDHARASNAHFSASGGLEPNPVHAIGMQRTWYWHDLPPMYYSHPPCPTPDG